MTGIQWTDETWNPTTGCDRVSPGCDHCYALTMAGRLKVMGQQRYQRDGNPATSGPGFKLTLHPADLGMPMRWRKPRRVFVNSMSDLFHDDVPDGFLASVWAAMAMTPRHTYQILTKRHGRMRALLSSDGFLELVEQHIYERSTSPCDSHATDVWPLPNVWGGVSVEDQKRAELRVPALVETPLAVRFLSCEPLIGPVDLDRYLTVAAPGDNLWCPSARRYIDVIDSVECTCTRTHVLGQRLDWVIVGGESGPGARVCDPEWIRSLVRQCQAARVPVFVKQLGSVWARWHGSGTGKGDDPAFWPADLRVREFPQG